MQSFFPHCLLATCLVLAHQPKLVTAAQASVAMVPPVRTLAPQRQTAPRVCSSELSRFPDGMFYAKAHINGEPTLFLVDTGATYVTMSEKDARRFGVIGRDSRFDGAVVTANGSAAMSWSTIDSFAIGGYRISSVKVIVVRNGPRVPLLGQNLLSKIHSITISGDSMRMDCGQSRETMEKS